MKKLLISVLIFAACTTQSSWTLVSGTPPTPDPDPIIYEGEVILEGTLILKSQYVGDPKPHIEISPDFTHALPNPEKTQYLLKGEGTYPEVDSTITIKAVEIKYLMEGSPIITFSEIL